MPTLAHAPGSEPDRQYHTLREQIGLSKPILWDILLFKRSLPILHTWRKLGWSHIRLVLRVPTQNQRLFYLRAADGERWTIRQLREAIRANAYAAAVGQPLAVDPDEDPQQGQPLRARFGELRTYKVVPGGDPASGELFLDLGFGVTYRAGDLGITDAQSGQLVTIARTPDNALTCTPRTPALPPPSSRKLWPRYAGDPQAPVRPAAYPRCAGPEHGRAWICLLRPAAVE